jgi:hypothetical protein
MEKLVRPKRFYAAFKTDGTPLYIQSLDPMQQGTRDKYIKSIETSFLREDVERIEVWSVAGPNGQIFHVETFTCYHPDLHFAPCECGCDSRVLTTPRYARCANCQKVRCTKHGKHHYKSGKSYCLDCYQAVEQQ